MGISYRDGEDKVDVLSRIKTTREYHKEMVRTKLMSRPEVRLQGISYRDGENTVDGIAHAPLPIRLFLFRVLP